MPKSKRKSTETYDFLSIEVTDYNAHVTSSISHKVRDEHHYWENANVYNCYTSLEIQGVLTAPEDRKGYSYELFVYGNEQYLGQFAEKLSDCHARDDRGFLKYRKSRGKEVPIYDIPNGLGSHERRRGTRIWAGTVWVPPPTTADMLTLLTNVRPLFLHIHERKIDRKRFIVDVTLQTSDPEEE